MNATIPASAKIECPWCSGKGKQPWFSHIQNGDCFPCGATGFFLDRKALKKARDRRGHQLTSPNGIKVTIRPLGTMAKVLVEDHTINEPGCGDSFTWEEMTIDQARQLYRDLKRKGWA